LTNRTLPLVVVENKKALHRCKAFFVW